MGVLPGSKPEPLQLLRGALDPGTAVPGTASTQLGVG